MTRYRLKKNQPPFEAVDGPLAGRVFTHNILYNEVPPGDRHRFHTEQSPVAVADKPDDKKKGGKK